MYHVQQLTCVTIGLNNRLPHSEREPRRARGRVRRVPLYGFNPGQTTVVKSLRQLALALKTQISDNDGNEKDQGKGKRP